MKTLFYIYPTKEIPETQYPEVKRALLAELAQPKPALSALKNIHVIFPPQTFVVVCSVNYENKNHLVRLRELVNFLRSNLMTATGQHLSHEAKHLEQ